MKKIIQRKRYDTEKATLIAEFNNGLRDGDFRSCSEQLYKTSNGAWFIYGKGGGLTVYGDTNSDEISSEGTDIIPLDEYEVIDWLETNEMTEELEKNFSQQIQDA